jgi:hypothetical protein
MEQSVKIKWNDELTQLSGKKLWEETSGIQICLFSSEQHDMTQNKSENIK